MISEMKEKIKEEIERKKWINCYRKTPMGPGEFFNEVMGSVREIARDYGYQITGCSHDDATRLWKMHFVPMSFDLEMFA